MTEAYKAVPVGDDSPDCRHIACVGFPVTGMQVRVTRGEVLAPREIGAIELRGPHRRRELSHRNRRRDAGLR